MSRQRILRFVTSPVARVVLTMGKLDLMFVFPVGALLLLRAWANDSLLAPELRAALTSLVVGSTLLFLLLGATMVIFGLPREMRIVSRFSLIGLSPTRSGYRRTIRSADTAPRFPAWFEGVVAATWDKGNRPRIFGPGMSVENVGDRKWHVGVRHFGNDFLVEIEPQEPNSLEISVTDYFAWYGRWFRPSSADSAFILAALLIKASRDHLTVEPFDFGPDEALFPTWLRDAFGLTADRGQ